MQKLSIKPKGLQTHPNQLSQVEPGAMIYAKNAVLDRDGVVEIRRGLKQYGTQLSFGATKKINTFYDFQNTLLAHYDNKIARDSDGAGTWVDYSGTFDPPSGALVARSIQANKNLYVITSSGLKKLEAVASAFATAGMPMALDGTGAVSGASGWMSNNVQVAYRVVWGIKDANSNLILGAPSQRIVVVNAAGATRNVDLAFTIPSGITTSHFFQVYRSVMSGGVAIDPNDELGLVYEANPTAGQITAKAVTFTDITPENLRGATLYTSPSQQGSFQANDQPPLCRDLVSFKGHVLFLNTVSKHRFFLTLVAVGGTGLVADDTITIAGTAYTAKAAENAAAAQFLVDTGGTAADNIENTALSLVRVINQYASNTSVYAYYVSGFNDLPGQIMIEERGIGGNSFAVISSRGNAWNPVLPSSGTTQSSTNFTAKNGIRVSKSLQPEAVPTTNILYAGSADKNILRGIALRDSVFIFKEDGIYRLVGDSAANFAVSLFDETVELRGDETACAFNNQAFCFSNQGVISVSETGVAVVSRPIEADLFVLAAMSNFEGQSFAIPYESDRKYIIFMPSSEDDDFPTQAYVFNVFTNAWTGPWLMNRSAGIVKRSDDRLYLGSWDQSGAYPRYVRQERKAFTIDDYADEEYAITISGSSGLAVTVASSANLAVKDKIRQSTRIGIITAIVDATHVTVDRLQAWTAAAAIAYRPIPVDTQFVPEHAENPGILKHFREGSLMFERAQFRSIAIGFESNFAPGFEDTEGAARVQGPWGLFPWGMVPWGGGTPQFQPIRVIIPRRRQRASWINLRLQHEEALSRFAYGGVSYQFEVMSERMR